MKPPHELSAFTAAGDLRMIVESPRHSQVKFKYEPDCGLFSLHRVLPVGITYPYDWGFIPGTIGEDGDPVDAMCLSEIGCYPGVIVPCRAIGLLRLSQNGKDGGRLRNDRLIVIPIKDEKQSELRSALELPLRQRAELEQFFLATTAFSQKAAKAMGWRGPREALALVRQGQRRARGKK